MLFEWFTNIFGIKTSDPVVLAHYRKHLFQMSNVCLHVYEHVLQEPSFTPDNFFDAIDQESVDLLLYVSPLLCSSSQLPSDNQLERDNRVFRSIKTKFSSDIWDRMVLIVTSSRHTQNLTNSSRYQKGRVREEFLNAYDSRKESLKRAIKSKGHFQPIPVIPVTERLPTSGDYSRFYKMPNESDWFSDLTLKMLTRCHPSTQGTLSDYFRHQERSHTTPNDSVHYPPHKRSIPIPKFKNN